MKSDFIKLHMDLIIHLPKVVEINLLDSATDPTQDIPVKMIQMTASGIPINVKKLDMPMTGVRIEDFTAMEKRNMDIFDALGEYQGLVGKVSQKGVTTDFQKPKGKTIKIQTD